MDKAREIFQQITGRTLNCINGEDSEIIGDLKLYFREKGKSGHPKLEIKNKRKITYEKITFL